MITEDLEQIGKVVDEKIKKRLQPINRKLKKIDHTIELILNYHDEMHIQLRKRVEQLERRTGLIQS